MLFKQPTPVRGAMRRGDKIESSILARFYARNRERSDACAIALRSARWITLNKLRDTGRRRASAVEFVKKRNFKPAIRIAAAAIMTFGTFQIVA